MVSWYVAKINIHEETILKTLLSNYDVEAFSPETDYLGQNEGTPDGLFLKCLFCYVDPESSFRPIVWSAPGTMWSKPPDGKPGPMPQPLVEYLSQRTTQWNDPGNSSDLRQGDKVVVTGGPFGGFVGVFQRYIDGEERCRILLDVVGRLTRVELPGWEVKGISSAPCRH